ncbi:MAG: hypothetical protein ACREE2_13915 [Stellaceae bacterium]
MRRQKNKSPTGRSGCSLTGQAMRLRTLLAIVGPGLIAMVGDYDAGAFSTYTKVGQNYGTSLLWTLLPDCRRRARAGAYRRARRRRRLSEPTQSETAGQDIGQLN